MSVIELKLDPTRRDLKLFGWLWLAFFGVVGGLVVWNPQSLIGAATFLTIAIAVSLALNASAPRLRQCLGLLIPLAFGAAGFVPTRGIDPMHIAAGIWGFGGLATLVIWLSPGFARAVYVGWMFAAEPIGWTISHAILGIVFYLVITPIGLVVRLLGNDPMCRKLDPSAATYWIPRKPVEDVKRYYRQF